MKKLLLRIAVCLLFAAPASARAQAAAGPNLQVATSSGADTYRVGERIGLTLTFSAPAGQAREISTANSNNSGRLMTEAFEVNAASGWADPLAEHYRNGMVMGGLAGSMDVSVTPFVLTVNLNEWVRFDVPGDYAVNVRTSRFLRDYRIFPTKGDGSIESDVLKLHILAATPEWQAATLAAALAQLRQPVVGNARSKARTDAIADIRFLATPAAIQAMAAGMRDDQADEESPFSFGLIGLAQSQHDEGVRAMKAKLDEPAFPISPSFLYTLAELERTGSAPEEVGRANQEAYAQIAAELSRKQGRARAQTAVTLLNQGAGPQPQNAQVAAALASSLAELRADEQANELAYQWAALQPHFSAERLQAMLEPVKGRAADARLDGIVLERWYELDPAAAKAKAQQLLETPRPSLSVKDVSFLPEQPLAASEGFWAQGLLDAGRKSDGAVSSRLMGLLARFGTGAAVAQVKAALEASTDDCNGTAAGIAYLVRFAPDLAGPFFVRETAGKARCGGNLFQTMAEFTYGPVVVRAAIDALDSPRDRVIDDAARFLMRFGDTSGQVPLRRHYEQWLLRWQGRGDELDQRPRDGVGNWEQREVGTGLARALIANQGWLSSKAEVAAVLAQCVSEQMCRDLQTTAYGQGPPYKVNILASRGSTSYRVAQYETASAELFDAKIAQFPEGTTFALELVPAASAEGTDPGVKALRAMFARHRMKLDDERRVLP